MPIDTTALWQAVYRGRSVPSARNRWYDPVTTYLPSRTPSTDIPRRRRSPRAQPALSLRNLAATNSLDRCARAWS